MRGEQSLKENRRLRGVGLRWPRVALAVARWRDRGQTSEPNVTQQARTPGGLVLRPAALGEHRVTADRFLKVFT